jgi:hypothetical protein
VYLIHIQGNKSAKRTGGSQNWPKKLAVKVAVLGNVLEFIILSSMRDVLPSSSKQQLTSRPFNVCETCTIQNIINGYEHEISQNTVIYILQIQSCLYIKLLAGVHQLSKRFRVISDRIHSIHQKRVLSRIRWRWQNMQHVKAV